MGEHDYFREIIERTAGNFIDVSQMPATIDSKDASERSSAYRSQLEGKGIELEKSAVLSLPTCSASTAQHIAVLTEATLSNADLEFIHNCADTLANAVADGMCVRDCGSLVESLPEIPA